MRRITKQNILSAALVLPVLLTMLLPAGAASLEAEPKDKRESVHVTAAADGTAKEVESEVVLLASKDGKKIADISSLTNIRNTEGDEEYTLSPDGTILWDNQGSDIHYKGDGSPDALPLQLDIRYTMDGKLCTPQMLKGQSGHLVIRFDYTNLLTQTVEADEEEKQVPVPLAALTLVPLDEDVFSNVSVTNGQVMSLGDSGAVVGMVLPGLRDALGLGELSYTEDIDLPEYLEIEADVTDFTLDFTATMVSTGLFNEVEDSDLKFDNDLDNTDADIDSAVNTMYSAADQLAEAVSQVRQALDAISQAQNTGLDNLSAQSKNLTKLFAAFTVPEDDPETKEDESLQTLAGRLKKAGETAQANGDLAVLEHLKEAEKMMEELGEKLLPKLQEENMVASAYFSGAEKGVTALNDGLEELENAVGTLRDGISDFKYNGSGDLKKLSKDAKKLQNILDNAKALKQAGLAYTSYSGIPEGKTGSVFFLYETEEIK